eukprot:CAMPEP_0113936792 /NCGR_PEP_ID=MMETSP1339-20121228/3588_1 /TAXON_ID=94617 /ORGANISM="Fibrocapsa japonica" /LENGTH=238 /DNA_ID=CAMNT_0000939347 /DNA_START=33 /DNA_END=749 /DNA_ORIENTATION=- /assembly_acc=CAM_ASM_000762
MKGIREAIPSYQSHDISKEVVDIIKESEISNDQVLGKKTRGLRVLASVLILSLFSIALSSQNPSVGGQNITTNLIKIPGNNPCMDPTAGYVNEGYDLVSYFQELPEDTSDYTLMPRGPLVGLEEFSVTLDGYTYLFASQENKEAFESNPDMYKPQFGGFCSFGVAYESIWEAETLDAPGNPMLYLKIEGKLYFFRSLDALDWFQRMGVKQGLELAASRWEGWYGDQVAYDTNCFWNAF